jgi:hypothetical protein
MHRFEDQRSFYHARRSEFEAARDQSGWLTSFLMILTGAAPALAAALDTGGLQWLCSVLAIAFPALATALAAYSPRTQEAFQVRRARFRECLLDASWLERLAHRHSRCCQPEPQGPHLPSLLERRHSRQAAIAFRRRWKVGPAAPVRPGAARKQRVSNPKADLKLYAATEQAVANLDAWGLNNQHVATELRISVNTS